MIKLRLGPWQIEAIQRAGNTGPSELALFDDISVALISGCGAKILACPNLTALHNIPLSIPGVPCVTKASVILTASRAELLPFDATAVHPESANRPVTSSASFLSLELHVHSAKNLVNDGSENY